MGLFQSEVRDKMVCNTGLCWTSALIHAAVDPPIRLYTNYFLGIVEERTPKKRKGKKRVIEIVQKVNASVWC